MSRQNTNKVRKTIEYITNTTIAKGKRPKMWTGEVISYNGLTKEGEIRIAGDPADNTNTFLNISGHVLRAGDLAYLTSYDGDLTNAYISNSREADDTYGNYVEFRYKRSATQPATPTGEEPTGWDIDPPSGTELLWMSKILRTPDGYIVEGETWSTPVRIQGEDGNYVEFRYKRAATQPDTPTGDEPTGWTTTIPSGTDTLWMSQVLKNTDGEIVSGASWSTPVQFTGEDGADGPPGPGIVYQGEFTAGDTYYYTSYRRDVVSYSGTYYLYNVSSGSSGNVVSSWNISEWEEFSETFKSVATALLLAEDATILNTLVMGYDAGYGSGIIRSSSKDSYGDTSAGFWLGYDGATPKFDIGNGTEYLRWDGSGLNIKGSINLTVGSDVPYSYVSSGPPSDADNTVDAATARGIQYNSTTDKFIITADIINTTDLYAEQVVYGDGRLRFYESGIYTILEVIGLPYSVYTVSLADGGSMATGEMLMSHNDLGFLHIKANDAAYPVNNWNFIDANVTNLNATAVFG